MWEERRDFIDAITALSISRPDLFGTAPKDFVDFENIGSISLRNLTRLYDIDRNQQFTEFYKIRAEGLGSEFRLDRPGECFPAGTGADMWPLASLDGSDPAL